MIKQASRSTPGFTIIEIVVVVAVIGIIAAAGYIFMASRSGSSLTNPLASVTLNSKCEYNDPDLCKFLNNWKEQKNYSISSTSDSAEEKDVVSVFEIEGADKSHILIKQGDTESYNVITIADTTYTKDNSDSKWWKQVKPKTDVTEDYSVDFDDNPTDNSDADKTTYTKKEKAACGDRMCFVYETMTGTDHEGMELIYFDDKEYILRQTVSEHENITTTSVFTYGKVKIAAPSPTKDAAADDMIMPGGQIMKASDHMTEEDMQQLMEDGPQDDMSDDADMDM